MCAFKKPTVALWDNHPPELVHSLSNIRDLLQKRSVEDKSVRGERVGDTNLVILPCSSLMHARQAL